MNRFSDTRIPADFIKVQNSESLPRDTVSCLRWFKAVRDEYIFACTSWDGTLRFYELTSQHNSTVINQIGISSFDSPLTCFCWLKSISMVIIGTADGRVIFFDVEKQTSEPVNQHNSGIRDLFYDDYNKTVISIDCESFIKVTSLTNTSSDNRSINVGLQVSAADFKDRILIVGLSCNKYAVINFNASPPDQITLNSPSETMIHSVRFGDTKSELLLGTADGRICYVRMEATSVYRISSSDIKTQYIFKENRESLNDNSQMSALFPVNDMACFRRNGYILALGCSANRRVAMWNLVNRQKYREIPFPGAVTNIDLHPNKELLVVATGYDWHLGVWGLANVNYSPGLFIFQYKNDDFRAFD